MFCRHEDYCPQRKKVSDIYCSHDCEMAITLDKIQEWNERFGAVEKKQDEG